MMRHPSLEHRFVRNVPRELEPGILYISMDYATAVHSLRLRGPRGDPIHANRLADDVRW